MSKVFSTKNTSITFCQNQDQDQDQDKDKDKGKCILFSFNNYEIFQAIMCLYNRNSNSDYVKIISEVYNRTCIAEDIYETLIITIKLVPNLFKIKVDQFHGDAYEEDTSNKCYKGKWDLEKTEEGICIHLTPDYEHSYEHSATSYDGYYENVFEDTKTEDITIHIDEEDLSITEFTYNF